MTIHKISVGYHPTTNEPTTHVQIVADDTDLTEILARAAERSVPMREVEVEHLDMLVRWAEYNVAECNPRDLFYAVWDVDAHDNVTDDALRELMTLSPCDYDVSHFTS